MLNGIMKLIRAEAFFDLFSDRKAVPYQSPRPEELDFAQSKVGSPLPYVYGTVRVDNGVLAWHGNHDATPVGSGFAYGLSMLIAVGIPAWDESSEPYNNWRVTNPPKLRNFWYGDKKAVSSGGALGSGNGIGHHESVNIVIDLAGDLEFSNRLEFFDGRSTQTLAGSAIHGGMVGAGTDPLLIPGYRNQMLVGITELGGIGASPRVASLGFEVSSLGPQPIGLDANPAWVLYDLLCSPVWKIGIDPARIDLPSFQQAANVLVGEEHGISLVIYRREDARRVLRGIRDQIGAFVFEDHSTGKIAIKLCRPDYTLGELKEMNLSNTLERPKMTFVSWADLKNESIVHFTNRERDFKPDTAIDHRRGNSLAQGNRARSIETHYPGCMTVALAAKLASRDLSVVARPLIAGTAVLNREFYDTLPGGVLKANWPQWDITDKVFRVFSLTGGQRAKGAITVVLVEDVFADQVSAGSAPPDPAPVFNMVPLTERLLDEAPYYLCEQLQATGAVPTLDQRIMAVAFPEGISTRFSEDTLSPVIFGFGYEVSPDVPLRFYNPVARVQTDYSRTAEPYDTATHLVINTAGLTAAALATFERMRSAAADPDLPLGMTIAEAIRFFRFNLILVVPSGQRAGGEIMAFEDIVDNGGGSYTLVNVWRGLLDTAPIDHAAGSCVYWLTLDDVGRKAWIASSTSTTGNAVPNFFGLTGSGDEGDDVLVFGRRIDRALRLADFGAAGYEAQGVEGAPLVAAASPLRGYFKQVTELDGALDLTGRQNKPDAGRVVRGDETTWSVAAGTTFDVYAQKVGEEEVALQTAIAPPFAPANVLLGKVGHGAIDLIAHTVKDAKRSWQSPRIRVAAARYRNLLAQGSFDSGALSQAWTTTSGSPGVFTGTSSLSRASTGKYLKRTAGADIPTVRQTIDVSGYKPVGLKALITWYTRNFDTESDTSVVTLSALDAANAVLADVTDPFLGIVGPTDHWRRASLELDLPLGTAQARVDISTIDAGGESGGDGASDAAVTGVSLVIGQFSSQLLTNPSFDGDVTGWTNLSGASLTFADAIAGMSDNGTNGYARLATTGVNYQDVAIPAGFEYGTAVVEWYQSHLTALGADLSTLGGVSIDVLDGASSPIGATGANLVNITNDTWQKRRAVIDLPDGAATLRISIHANASGAAFDDLTCRIHKHLDAPTTIDFDFGEPARAHAPNNWQRFHLAYPTLAIPVVWADNVAAPSVQDSARIDSGHTRTGGAQPAGTMRGYFYLNERNAPLDDLACFNFDRATASDVVALPSDPSEEYGKFTAADSFTVGVLLRSTELAWGGASGLAGRRRDSDDIGWGLQIDATGRAKAVFKGDASELSVTSADVVCDRSPRWVFLKVDAGTMKLFTKAGTASTALVGLGSSAIDDVRFRIGRDGVARSLFHGQIARVYLWDSALADADLEAMVDEIGADPSGLLTSYVTDQPVWIPGPPNSAGDTLIRCAATDVPIAYSATLAADGDGYGLVTTRENTNRVQSFDVRDTTRWGLEGGGYTISRNIVDPTGLPMGISVGQESGGSGIRITDMPAPLSAFTWTTIIYLRDASGADELDIELLDSDENVVDVVNISITSTWKRYEIRHSWNGATPTCHLRFVRGSGGTGTYEIGHVVWSGYVLTGAGVVFPNVSTPPIAIQDAGQAISHSYGVRSGTLPLQLHYEGELYVEGTQPAKITDTTLGSLVTLDNGVDLKNLRGLFPAITVASPGTQVAVFNDTPIAIGNSQSPAYDIAASWVARGRWNRLEIPDAGAQVSAVVNDGSGDQYDPTPDSEAPWTIGGANNRISIGNDGVLNGYRAPSAILRRVIVRSREEKLTGT